MNINRSIKRIRKTARTFHLFRFIHPVNSSVIYPFSRIIVITFVNSDTRLILSVVLQFPLDCMNSFFFVELIKKSSF